MRKLRTSVVLMVLSLGMIASGCAVIHPTDPYRQFNPPKSIERQASVPAHEIVLTDNDSLTLPRAIEIALANNPGITAAAWEIERAAAQQNVAVGELLPRLYGTGGYMRNLDPQRLVAVSNSLDPAVFSRDIASADVVLQMPLFSGGRLVNNVRAASLLEQSAKHRFARSREELVYNVTSVFYSILAQRRVVESVEFSQKTLQEHLKRVETLVESQKAALVDRLRTEVRLADVTQRLVREANTLDIQHRLLANLLGLESDTASLAIKGELDQVVVTPELDTDSMFTAAQVDRGDYLAARSGLEAQARTVDAARAAHWPTLSLQGSYGYRWAVDDDVRVSGASTSEDIGRIGIVFDLPFFEGGRVRARVSAERARMAEQQARLRQLELQMQLEVETALLNRQAASNRLKATGKAVDQATESLRIEREKYELGRGAIVDVLDAQSALLDAQTNHYRALADLHISQAQLKLATGSEQ